MAIEGEIMTIHQKIADAHRKNKGQYGMGNDKPMRSFDAPKISDIEEIKQVLQYILDKLHGMDAYMRTNMQAKNHRVHDGESQEVKDQKELIRKLNDLEEKLHVNDSKEADSGTREAPKQATGSGSCATRQGDFRARDSSNPDVAQKDSDNLGEKKVNDKPKA